MPVIRTALAAYGLSGKIFHAPFLLAHPAFELVAIVERNRHDAAELFVGDEPAYEQAPAPQRVQSYEALLLDKSLDLIVVNTPSGLHYEMVTQALNAGKHVVVEKPFTATWQQAKTLITLAKEKKLMLSVYHNRRLESGFLTVQKLLAAGTLGAITQYRTCVDRYRPQLGIKRWKEEVNPAAGLLYDFGSHLVDEILQLFGRPQSISADIFSQRQWLKKDVSECALAPDYFVLRCYYNNVHGQFCAELRASMVALAATPHYILHGSQGSYVKAIGDIQEAALQSGKRPNTASWCVESRADWGQLHRPEGVEDYPSVMGCYQNFYHNIAEVLKHGADLQVQPEQAAEVIELLEVAQRSASEGRIIEL